MNTVRIAVRLPTDVAEARRRVVAQALRCGFGEVDCGRAAIVATELATNLIRHGGGGELLLDELDGLQMLALDRGPGIAEVEASLADGFSTGGTRGEGLGAVRRLAETFDLWSRPGQGTAALARLSAGRVPPDRPAQWAAVCLPYPGEALCGDGWRVRRDAGAVTLMVADGLGHGFFAHEATVAALAAFDRHGAGPLSEALAFVHGALRATRGAAVSLARVIQDKVEFAGVGNVSGVVFAGGAARKMISHNGTLGHVAKRFQTFDYPAAGKRLVVLHSDGLATSWSLDAYPGLAFRDPALVSGVLYRDFTRGRDDVTVLAFVG